MGFTLVRRISNGGAAGLFATFIGFSCQAQTTAEIIQACAQGGAAVYRTRTAVHSIETLARADYFHFCRTQRDWSKMEESDQKSFGASYAGYGASFSQGGAAGSEAEKYDAFCSQADSKFANSNLTTSEVEDIRGGVDAYMLACMELAKNNVKMVTDLPQSPEDSLIVTFSTSTADRKIESVDITNGTCKLDGVDVGGNLDTPRVFTNDTAEIICKRTPRPIPVYGGGAADYYGRSQLIVRTNFSDRTPQVTLEEEVAEPMRTRLSTLEDRMVPLGTIIALAPGNVCPEGWATYNDASDRVLMGASMATPAGTTGGHGEVQLTIAEMPRHNHGGHTGNITLLHRSSDKSSAFAAGDYAMNQVEEQAEIPSEGDGRPFSVLPPFLAVVYCVKQQR